MNQLLTNITSVTNKENLQYSEVENFINNAFTAIQESKFSIPTVDNLKASLGNEFLSNTLHGHSLSRPYGYAGDFEIIDKIYTCKRSKDTRYKAWDEYILNMPASIAVRNRKEYFKSFMWEKLEANNEVKLLNVASGPARDVTELLATKPTDSRLNVTCVEMDQNAIDYAKKITNPFKENIEFICKNIFRFHTKERYDVVWSAGLFDYFDAKGFVHLLKRFKEWTAPNGEIIIGNFNADHNPNRQFMELFADWHLIHRTENELIELAIQAGFDREQLTVNRESQNVNLFLHIQL